MIIKKLYLLNSIYYIILLYQNHFKNLILYIIENNFLF